MLPSYCRCAAVTRTDTSSCAYPRVAELMPIMMRARHLSSLSHRCQTDAPSVVTPTATISVPLSAAPRHAFHVCQMAARLLRRHGLLLPAMPAERAFRNEASTPSPAAYRHCRINALHCREDLPYSNQVTPWLPSVTPRLTGQQSPR